MKKGIKDMYDPKVFTWYDDKNHAYREAINVKTKERLKNELPTVFEIINRKHPEWLNEFYPDGQNVADNNYNKYENVKR